MRRGKVARITAETDIELNLNLDGRGKYANDTGCGFLNHMLDLFAKHGRFDLSAVCKGDTWVDDHHTVEDVAIALGTAFKEALGDKRGIKRYGYSIIPMDETLMLCSVDISGRTYLNFDVEITTQKVGSFDTELVKEFMLAFARSLELNLHFKMLAGENTHHIIEAVFKSFGRAMAEAVCIDEDYSDEIPSTKGIL